LVWLLLMNVAAGLAACGLLIFEGYENELIAEVIMQRMARPGILGTFSALQGAGLVGCVALVLRMWGYPLGAGFAVRGARPVAWLAALGVGGSIGFFSGWVSQEIARLLPSLDGGHLDLFRTLLLDGPLLPRLPMFFAIVVVAPLAEEWVFRGALWTFLEDSFGPVVALLGTTLLFSAYHLDPLHVLGVIPTALCLGLLRGATRSVWPGVLAHAANNVLGVLAILLLPEEASTTGLAAGIALGVSLLCLLGCWRWAAVRPAASDEPEDR
jgi:membrane protease YdiL (CAAX protease family)